MKMHLMVWLGFAAFAPVFAEEAHEAVGVAAKTPNASPSPALATWLKRFEEMKAHCDPAKIKAAPCAYDIERRIPGDNATVGTLLANVYMPMSDRGLDADAKIVRDLIRGFAKSGARHFPPKDAPCRSICWVSCVTANLLVYDHSHSKTTEVSTDGLNRLMHNEQRHWSDLMSSADSQSEDGKGFGICRNFGHFGADFFNIAFADAGGWLSGKGRAAIIAGEGDHSYVAAVTGSSQSYFFEPQIDGFADGQACRPRAYWLTPKQAAKLEQKRSSK